MWLVGLFLFCVPLLLIGVLAFQHQPGFVRWLLNTLAFGMVICYMWATARWDLISVYLRTIFPLLFIIASIAGYRRIASPATPLSKLQSFIGIGVNVVLIVFMSGLSWFTFRGYMVPEPSVELTSPLREGSYVVLHGGSSPFINAHFRVKPQNYALDILGLNRLGARADVFGNSRDLHSYEIYGATVYSPCTGSVAASVDEHQDLVPPARDTEHLAGNHVLIACKGVEVLLAHLKQGSVVVQVGESVTTGMKIGEVGNTGNSSEPHLHIHAERGGESGVILDGEAVPVKLDGRYLVRGDIIGSKD